MKKPYRILYVGVTTVWAENDLDAEECFRNGDVADEQIDVLSIKEVQDVRSEEE